VISRPLVGYRLPLIKMTDAIDQSMADTYDLLATRACELLTQSDGAVWIAIAGGPGAGKSTLAEAVSARVNKKSSAGTSVVLPMDGFHYSRAQLRELDPPDAASFLPRRGSPWTFDAEGLYDALASAKSKGEASLPTYSRQLSDPVADGVCLKTSHRCIFVEGNYLLLCDDPRWAPLMSLWDQTWFISCADASEQRRRLIARHLETWNDEKTARWGPGEAGAAARADANDVKNMDLVSSCARHADVLIESR